MKKGTVVKIIKSIPEDGQDQLNLNDFIDYECEVIGHWKQRCNNDWNKGQIQVVLQGEGVITLNKGEYEIVLN